MIEDYLLVFTRINGVLQEYSLVDVYANYSSTLNQIASSSTAELQTALKDYKQRVNHAHKEFSQFEWTHLN